MKQMLPFETPDAYVASLKGWQLKHVKSLRAAVLAATKVEETIKWGHLVYFSNGPVCLIRAEDSRVLFGFWRGKRLTPIEPSLKPSGQYEMATIHLNADTSLASAKAKKLASAAVALNTRFGDPRLDAKKKTRAQSSRPIKKAKSHGGK